MKIRLLKVELFLADWRTDKTWRTHSPFPQFLGLA